MAGKATIGGKIALEGADEYNKQLKTIASTQKELRSEMKLATAEYKNNANSQTALQAKGEILTKQLTEASKKYEVYTKMLEESSRAHEDAGRSLETISHEYEEACKALDEMEKSSDTSSDALDAQRETVDRLKQELDKTQSTYDKTGLMMNQYASASNNAKAEVLKLDSAVSENEKYLQEAAQSADGCATSIDQYGKEVKETAEEASQAAEKVSVFGDVLKASLTAEAIVAGVKVIANGIKDVASSAIETGASFEAAMSQVGAVSGASADEMEKLTAKAKEMGSTTMFSATESAEAMNYMAMAGWKTEDMLKGLDGIMNLAAASGAGLATTSDIITDDLTAFGMSAEDAGHMADVFATASSNANTNVEMLGATFEKVAPVAGSMGYSLEDMSIAAGLLANSSIKAESAGTALKTMLANLAKPTDAQAAAMQKLGISLTDAQGNMIPFRELLMNLRTGFSTLTESQKTQYATTLAGKEAMSAMMVLVNSSQADFDKLAKAIDNADGAAAEMAAKMQDNLTGDITILKSALEGLGIAFYDTFDEQARESVQGATDVITELTESVESGDLNVSLSKMADSFGDFSERALDFASGALPNVIDGLTWIMDNSELIISGITGMVTAQAAQKTVVPIIEACQAAYVSLTTAEEGATVAQAALNVVMDANPIGLLVTAIGFAVGALGTYVALAGNAADQTNAVAASTMNLTAKLNENVSQRQANATNMKAEAETSRKLASELEALQRKTELSADEQIRQREIVEELNSIMPDLSLTIDEQTGKLDEHSRAVLEDVDSLMKRYELEAAQEDLKDIAADLYEAEKKLNEVETERATLLEQYNELDKERSDLWEDQKMTSGALQSQLDELDDQLYDLDDAQAEASATVAKLKGEFESTTDIVKSDTEALGENADAQGAMGDAASAAADQVGGAAAEISEATDQLHGDVAKTVSEINPLFDELATKTDETLASVTENLKNNAKAAQEFADTLNSATSQAAYGTNEAYTNIVNTLAEQGPEATALLKEMVTGAEENSEDFKAALDAMSEYMSSNGNVVLAAQTLAAEVDGSMSNVAAAYQTGAETVTTTLQSSGEEQKSTVQSTATDITETFKTGAADMTAALKDESPKMNSAMQLAMTDVTQSAKTVIGESGGRSTVFYNMGKSLMTSLASGITAGSGTVKTAMQKALQSAIDSLDLSGFRKKIDKALGDAMNK